MEDQKIENLLNLALEATEGERQRSLNLGTGFDRLNNRWEVIVKYNGDLSFLEEEGVRVVTLYGGYAILDAPAGYLEALAALPEIEYMEVPKRLFFNVNQGKRASCITSLQTGGGLAISGGLTGRGVLVGIVDSGIDLAHPDFRNEDGTTRVRWLWDQTAVGQGQPPEGYYTGIEYSRADINHLLGIPDDSGNEFVPRQTGPAALPGADYERHGTAVAGIAAGNGRASNGRFAGAAPDSELIVVKLGLPVPGAFPRTSELMQALNYVILKAAGERTPLAVNVSIGNSYGSHDGSSLLERFIDQAGGVGRTEIIIGSGNEGDAGGHTSGRLKNPVRGSAEQTVEVELAVGAYETELNLQLWKSYSDQFEVTLITPSGQRVGPFTESQPVSRYRIPGAVVLVYYGEPSPYRTAQELYLDFLPDGDYLESGIYFLELKPIRIVEGIWNLWLPSQAARQPTTRFLRPDPETTLTIPSTAGGAISAAAYNSAGETYAPFSGRGFTRTGQVKPDIAAPGVNIVSAAPGGGYGEFTGTSFAAPFVTGGAALLMEWGIVRGNDPYLYGEKVKAYLRRGARPLPGLEAYPNPQVGYGTLCVRDSLPK